MMEVSWSEAIERSVPEAVVLVISCDKKGKPNVMPAGWAMITSGKPPMLAVAINHVNYTHKLIEETGEFVLAFPNEEMKGLVEYTGSCSGRDVDKFSNYTIETFKSKCVKPPLIKDAVACFECSVRRKLVTGDHTIFAGEVVASHMSEKYEDRLFNFGSGEFRAISNQRETKTSTSSRLGILCGAPDLSIQPTLRGYRPYLAAVLNMVIAFTNGVPGRISLLEPRQKPEPLWL